MLSKLKSKFKKVENITNEEDINLLKNHNCNMCHNHCSLDKVKCGRGMMEQQKVLDSKKPL